MTSRIVDPTTDPDNVPGDINAIEESLREAVSDSGGEETIEATTSEETPKEVSRPEWIKEKFWTGELEESAAKQAKAYSPLETAYGRMANDLGTQRKITDKLILGKRDADLGLPEGTTQVPEAPKVDSRKLVENPTEALDEYWKRRESELLQKLDDEQRRADAQAIEARFLGKHPDFQDVVQSNEFSGWVKESPLRTRAAALAANGDYSVADELLDEYKGTHTAVEEAPPEKEVVQDSALEAARKAATESASASGAGVSKKKVWRRADLIELRMRKPQLYADPSFQEEIMAAYAEGRVK